MDKFVLYNYNVKDYEFLNENYSTKQLLSFLWETHYKNIISFDLFMSRCDALNLKFKMPGHFYNVPWLDKNGDADIITNEQLLIFIKYL